MNKNADSIDIRHNGISRTDREALLQQKGAVLWLTGLSASGKTTLAHAVERALHERGHLSVVLDGDVIRQGLNSDLGFSPKDRTENIRRVGEVAGLFCDTGIIALTAFISPYRSDRHQARSRVEADRFVEIFVDVPLQVAEERDPKGLYAKARRGEIPEFTGITAPYETPLSPELHLPTAEWSVPRCLNAILTYLEKAEIIPTHGADRHGRPLL
ncbi:adenylyl-sulfate kinase [candidate division KSB1 bacterium]|nr:adenylyl-sulfate kinase [candidate division KSB1 bacterium]